MDWNLKIPINTLSGVLFFGICTKKDYECMSARKFSGCCSVLSGYCSDPEEWERIPRFEKERVLGQYGKAIADIIEDDDLRKILKVPYSMKMHNPDIPDNLLPSRSVGEKLVYDYTGIDFLRQENMNYLQWLQLCADSAKYNLSGTAEGVEMLNSAYDEMFVPFDRNAFLHGR